MLVVGEKIITFKSDDMRISINKVELLYLCVSKIETAITVDVFTQYLKCTSVV